MDFAFTDRCNEYRATLLAFMDECIYPNESVFHEQLAASGDPHHHPAVMEELKKRARDADIQKQKKDAEAKVKYEKVLSLNSHAGVAANNLAWIYAASDGNLDMALQLAQTAKAQLPDRPEVNDTLDGHLDAP